MSAARRILTILFTPYDLRPFSRAEFLRPALEVFFIRQFIVGGIVYLAILGTESPKLPESLQLLVAVFALILSLCFLIPYFTLMYKRLLGSVIPFPRLIICALFVSCFFFPSPDQPTLKEAVFDFILSGVLYLILFLLPDGRSQPCETAHGSGLEKS